MAVRRGFVIALATCLAVLGTPSIARAAPDDADALDRIGRWVRPVEGPVAAAFAPPATRYGRGHLGVDFLVAPSTLVRAAGAGTVTYSGVIAGSRHVVIAHEGGLRTSYSFVATARVRRGDSVGAGEVIATTGGTGGAHDGSVLHLGLRSGDTYLDPLVLFQPVDLAAVVHLAPTHHGPRLHSTTQERRGLLEGLGDLAGDAIGVSLDFARAGVRGTRAAAEMSLRSTAPLAAPTIEGVASSLTAWMRHRRNCDAHAPAADGTGGSGHRVMVVAGIDSRRSARGASLAVPLDALGYQRGEITYFSYARGGAYEAADTHAPIMRSARRLGDQLRALQRREPGREVDLVAHSQGGVVVLAFLALVYDPADPAYPPLGTVVTLSSPLAGAPLATAATRIAGSKSGRAFLADIDRLAARTGLPVPPTRAPSVHDLAEGSPLMRRLDASALPGTIDLTTVGAVTDPAVPSLVATRPGADHTVVATSPFNAHSAVQNDADALRAMRAALEQRPVPCTSWKTAVAAALVGPSLTAVERGTGTLGKAAGVVADAVRE